jgi:Flp pilus assembly protein TadG
VGIGHRLRHTADEAGQVLVLSAIAMVVLLGMVGFAIDVGHAYLVQRQLQSGVDAAALAGAQELPDPTLASQVAKAYGPDPSKKNNVTTVDNASTSVEMRCVTSAPGCSPAFGTFNAINVKATSTVKTVFAKVLGIDSFDVKAQATACSPCSAKPLDVMLVLDRTGSMCDDPGCSDLNNAKNGIRQFLTYMDPAIDYVGLAVFPPAMPANRCAAPTSARNWNYDTTDSRYVISSLQYDYLRPDGTLNPASTLVQMIDCTQAAGRTSYADAIEESMTELATHGRGDVQDVIIFLSDGAANTGSKWRGNDTPYRLQPCHQGVWSAGTAKANNMLVYTIGYGLAPNANSGEQCHPYDWSGSQQSDPELPPILAREALAQMATDADSFYNTPDNAQLAQIYARIAADISRPAARLIDDNAT